jgi:hypothetical protein
VGLGRRSLTVGSAVLTLGLFVGAGAAGTGTSVSHAFIPARARETLPAHGSFADSGNWSGYVVQQSNITGVDGSFVVPAVDGTPGEASIWAGIGGFGTSDLIQAGVQIESLGVGIINAWYEILPGDEVALTNCNPDPNCTVNVGDVMAVHIHQTGTNSWSVQEDDTTAGWTFTIPLQYASRQLSAEWILESPTLLGLQTILPLMHDTLFTGTNTFNVGSGGPEAILAGNPTGVEMNPLAAGVPVDEGSPTPLDGTGEGFTACAYPLLGCPSPSLFNLL